MQRKQSGFAVMDVTGERSGRVLAESLLAIGLEFND